MRKTNCPWLKFTLLNQLIYKIKTLKNWKCSMISAESTDWGVQANQLGIPLRKDFQHIWISKDSITDERSFSSGANGKVFLAGYQGDNVLLKYCSVSFMPWFITCVFSTVPSLTFTNININLQINLQILLWLRPDGMVHFWRSGEMDPWTWSSQINNLKFDTCRFLTRRFALFG